MLAAVAELPKIPAPRASVDPLRPCLAHSKWMAYCADCKAWHAGQLQRAGRG